MVRPARDGALRVLQAARDAGVRRVVHYLVNSRSGLWSLRSSRPFTEVDWPDPSARFDTSAYERSKMISKLDAWDWHTREGGALELVTFCPGAMLCPVLSDAHSASIDILKRLIEGSLPGLPRLAGRSLMCEISPTCISAHCTRRTPRVSAISGLVPSIG